MAVPPPIVISSLASAESTSFVTAVGAHEEGAGSSAPPAVVMILPRNFNANPETAVDNVFQDAHVPSDVGERARREVTLLADTLREAGVIVHLFEDLPSTCLPDSVFPNNWISTHTDGRVVLYPMATPSRRRERRRDIVDALAQDYLVRAVVDYSPLEEQGLILEGTGALVLDHVHKLAFMTRSGRASESLLSRWCNDMGFEPVVFDSTANGQPIYHTNVVLSLGSHFALVGLENIADPAQRAHVHSTLASTGRTIIPLTPHQVNEFAGNGLELQGATGLVFAMSQRAHASLSEEQLAVINTTARVLSVPVPTIELEGGSVRCMLAGIHLPPRT
eukprot:m.77676 g.77676  ORF g.77676 m.77676 type:complete len:334 (-) comp7923_c0_seq1:623-1624(-)